MYDLVELRGVGPNEKVRVLKSDTDQEKLEKLRDQLQAEGLATEGNLTKLRYALRCR